MIPIENPAIKQRALRSIAAWEALKGCLAIAACMGLIGLMHHDLRHLAVSLIGHVGLNPTNPYASAFLDKLDWLRSAHTMTLVFLGSAYSLLRFTEAYGLWRQCSWGLWLGALSGGVYVPFEAMHLVHQPSLAAALVLGANVTTVVFLVVQVWLEPKVKI